MCRDYEAMRSVLSILAAKGGAAQYGAFYDIDDEDSVKRELSRLASDGLVDSSIAFQDGDGICLGGEARITDEGLEFFRLIENGRAWKLMVRTLDAAGIDVSYPLLKEVCEEIVKRYVASFIPDIGRTGGAR